MFSFKINPFFIVIVVLFAVVGMVEEVLAAFSMVLLHELTHVLTALKIGYDVKKIELFPFGGMAEYKGLLEMEPWHEILIALSGPMLNLFLAGLFLFLEMDLFVKYNLIIGVFNLLPALPLDGGRVLRGILVSKFGFKKGTYLAVKVAKVLAVAGFGAGIVALILYQSNIWILFISFFVYGATVKEKNQVVYSLLTYLTRRQEYINNIHLKRVITQAVSGDIYLKQVISYLIPHKFNIFYVLDNDNGIAGIVSEDQLLDQFFSLKDRDKEIIEIVE